MIKLHYNPTKLALEIAENENRTEIICFNLVSVTKKVHLEINLAKRSSCRIIVLVKVSRQSSLELITSQNHFQRGATSNLLCKALVGEGEFIYRGRVFIAKAGDLTHAYQRNENLLLSEQAQIISEPSLEILANNVYCTHAAASGPLDKEQLYYLQTRGMSYLQAKELLSRGFLLSGIDQLLINPEFNPSDLDKLQTTIKQFFFK
jgi:Fe-S cluster assembly scaffold protein SufB